MATDFEVDLTTQANLFGWIETRPCFRQWTKQETELHFKGDLAEMKCIIRNTVVKDELGLPIPLFPVISRLTGLPIDVRVYTLSFYRSTTYDKINHIRIYVSAMGLCIKNNFEEFRTFPTILALLTQQLLDHQQPWGNELRPYILPDTPAVERQKEQRRRIEQTEINLANILSLQEMFVTFDPSTSNLQLFKEKGQQLSGDLLQGLLFLQQYQQPPPPPASAPPAPVQRQVPPPPPPPPRQQAAQLMSGPSMNFQPQSEYRQFESHP